jgi:GT2 family glycosyltransferase
LIKQPRRGPAAARNLGANEAKGEVIIFLDSDMIVSPDFLIQHLDCHKHYPNSLIAGTRSPYPTPGEQYPFEYIEYFQGNIDPRALKTSPTYQDALSCNLSIRRKNWAKLLGFNEDFLSFEDIEFAYRASQLGLEIRILPSAHAYHNHPLTLEQRFQRAALYTSSIPLLFHLHPELKGQIDYLQDKEPINKKSDPFKLILRKIFRRILAIPLIVKLIKFIFTTLLTLKAPQRFIRFFYWKIIGSYQWIGLRQGIQRYGW